MRPGESLAVDVFLEQALPHHQPEIAACAPPGRVGGFVDDVPEIVEAARQRRLQCVEPLLAATAALPGARGETQNLHFDPGALERACENVGAAGRDHDRASAHRAGIVEQKRHHSVAELGFALLLKGQWLHWVDDDADEPRGVDLPLVEVEIPAAVLLCEEAALKTIGEPRHGAVQGYELLVEEGAQAVELVDVAQLLGVDYFVEGAGEHLVAEGLGIFEYGEVRPPRLGAAWQLGGVGLAIEP